MAIDPRISLLNQPLNVGQRVGSAISNVAGLDLITQQREQAPFQNQLLQLQAELGQAQQPSQLQVAEEAASPLAQLNRRDQARLQSVVQGAQELSPLLEANDITGARSQLIARKARLTKLGLPTETTDESLELLDSNPDLLRQRVGQALQLGRQSGLLKGSGVSVGQREFETLVEIAKGDPEGKTIEGRAAGVKLGTIAKASSSAAERIATDPVLTSAVAASTAEIAGAKETATEGAKLTQQLKHKPAITRAVKLAEKEATERGEVLTSLNRSKAALPGLLTAVGELRELATLATSTFGGKLFDAGVKQTGFGSTKGATARAKFIAIINNQVLPLLKETFGAAFTVQEGESLKATMGDPDSTPEEKMAQLDAFIAQKRRDVETKQRQLDLQSIPESIRQPQPSITAQPTTQQPTEQPTTPTQPTIIRFDAQGNLLQ
jgi:hypothetical protein